MPIPSSLFDIRWYLKSYRAINPCAIVTSAVRLAHLPTAPKDHSAQNALTTPNTIYMPKAATVRRTNRTPLITAIQSNYLIDWILSKDSLD